MRDKGEFLTGLGEGAGHYLPVIGGRTLEEIMLYASSSSLAVSAARGVIESFDHLDFAEVIGILEYGTTGSAQSMAKFLLPDQNALKATISLDQQ